MMTLSRTMAPGSTRTPGESTERSTVPAMRQPWLMRLRWTLAVGPMRAGARSSERVWMTQSRSYRSSAGMVVEQLHLGAPVAVDGAHVLPVAVEVVAEDARAAGQHGRHHVGAEVGPIVGQPVQQGALGEDVDAQAGQVAAWAAWASPATR